MNPTHVRVLNRNDFVITDRYDGVPYSFAPGKETKLAMDAAAHIFGWPVNPDESVRLVVGDGGAVQPDLAHVCRRWGWNSINQKRLPDGTLESLGEAVERQSRVTADWVSKIQITAFAYALREVVPDETELALAPPTDHEEQGETEAKPRRGKMTVG